MIEKRRLHTSGSKHEDFFSEVVFLDTAAVHWEMLRGTSSKHAHIESRLFQHDSVSLHLQLLLFLRRVNIGHPNNLGACEKQVITLRNKHGKATMQPPGMHRARNQCCQGPWRKPMLSTSIWFHPTVQPNKPWTRCIFTWHHISWARNIQENPATRNPVFWVFQQNISKLSSSFRHSQPHRCHESFFFRRRIQTRPKRTHHPVILGTLHKFLNYLLNYILTDDWS